MHVITAETREHFACTSPTDWAKLLQTAPQRCLQSMGSPACTKLYPLYSATCWITRICSAVTHRSQSHNLPPPPSTHPPSSCSMCAGVFTAGTMSKTMDTSQLGAGGGRTQPMHPTAAPAHTANSHTAASRAYGNFKCLLSGIKKLLTSSTSSSRDCNSVFKGWLNASELNYISQVAGTDTI